ncbi:MAG: alpha/beta hydrolase [Paracoccaceae bacterium]
MKIFVLLGLATSAACADDHTPLSFAVFGDEIIASGEIDSDSLDLFEDMIGDHPNAKTLVLQYIGGSVDDEANVKFARVVRDLGLTTRVPSDGLVASGGTDLFLAGVNRVLEAGACLGVHSWAAEDFTATDLPRSDPEHDRYLSYYQDVGIDAAFYWFTLQVAPADGMHWMTSEEVARFSVSTNQATSMGTQAMCDDR